MPDFAFTGFTAGSSVALSVAQGASSASSSVVTWGQGSVADINFVVSHSGEIVAPFGVHLDALPGNGFSLSPQTGTYDPETHEITYFWTVTGTPLSAPQSVLNLPDSWRNRNVAYGKSVGFMLDQPGTYTIELFAVDEAGNSATASWGPVTVQDPDSVYTGARTAVYSASGTFTGKPAGAVECTSRADVEAFLQGLSQTGRVLFRRGETHPFAIAPSTGYDQNARFGAFGTGSRPILTLGQETGTSYIFNFFSGANTSDVAIYDLELRGEWDATREEGYPRISPWSFLTTRNTAVSYFAINNVKVSGMASTSFQFLDDRDGRVITNDLEITNWKEYGIYQGAKSPGARIVHIGLALHQDADACLGSAGSGITYGENAPFSNNGASLRDFGSRQLSLQGCSFFSSCGWSRDGSIHAAASPLRLNTGGNPASRFNLDRVSAEGGYQIVTGAENNGIDTVAFNFVADKVLFCSSSDTINSVTWGYSACTWRNIYFVVPDSVKLFNRQDEMFSFITTGTPSAAALNEPIRVHNCTFLNLLTNANNGSGDVDAVRFQFGGETFTNTTVENNVEHAPAQLNPVTSDAPVETVTGLTGFQPKRAGIRFSVDKNQVTLGSNVPHGGTFTVGYPDRRYVNPANPNIYAPVATGPGAFSATGANHGVKRNSNGAYYFRTDGDIAVSFGVSDVTITNLSGETWSAGESFHVNLVPIDFTTETGFASPGSIPTAQPGSASLANDSATAGLVAKDDFNTTPRPGSGLIGAPSGSASRGAREAI